MPNDNPGGRARARGRARGRARAQQPADARRPGEEPQDPAYAQAAAAAAPVVQAGGRAFHRQAVDSNRGAVGGLATAMASTSLSGHGDSAGRGAIRGGRDISDAPHQPPPRFTGQKRGASGEPMTVLANYFQLKKTPNTKIYFYHVDLSPDIDHKKLRRVLVGNQRPVIGHTFLFDGGSSLYLPHCLPEKEMELISELRNGDKVRLTLKFARELAPNDPIVIQIMNVQMRRNMQNLKFQLLGRHYYDQEARQIVQGANMEVWPGFITSIRQHETDVLLMVDSTSKVLRKDTVFDQIDQIRRNARGDVQQEVNRQLLGAIVMTTYNKNTYRIDDISYDDTPMSTFKKRDEDITYVDYYRQHWDITIRNVRQPLIISRPTRRDQKVGRTQNYYLVPELCCMTGLTDDMRADFQLTRKLSEYTRKGPDERVQGLLKFMSRVKKNPECIEGLKGWGLDYADNLVQVSARRLPTEIIVQGTNRSQVDFKADWTRSLRSNRLDSAVPLNNWMLVCTERDRSIGNGAVETLRKSGQSMGLVYSNPIIVAIPDARPQRYIEGIKRHLSNDIQIVVCILPNKNKGIYDAIKKFLTVDHPVPSQCIVSRTVSDPKKAMSTCTKIGIQINVKVGGEAWHVDVPLKKLMVMGFDTYHDSSQRGRSVGAFISSLNQNCTRWHSSVTFLHRQEEIASKIAPMFISALRKYEEFNGFFPEKFVMYRDGVSDGQMNMVIEQEANEIYDAIKKMTNTEPKLSYIIVNKRINTRFYSPGKGGRCENPIHGCVVDSEVTRPERYDFFLVSQSVNQGTVAPTQYVVAKDTLGMAPDYVQRLAYKMTHMYYNWPGTVRVPAPCQYAHKLAFLVGQSLHKPPDQHLSDTLFYL